MNKENRIKIKIKQITRIKIKAKFINKEDKTRK